jgi:uncharacterized protein involved in exopolysaccharide biosynthesis
MSINQFFRMLWAKRILIGVTTAAAVFMALFVSWVMPPRYEATSRVMLDIVKPDPVTGEVIASQWARAYVKTQIELIRDYRVAGKAADEAGWLESPELAEEFRNSGAADDMEFRRWLAQRIIDNTEAQLVSGSNILEITYTSTSPEPAAKLADLVRDAYVDQTLSFRREAAARNAEWFDEQTEEIREQLTAAQDRKTAFERENGVILTDDLVDTDTARLRALASSPPPIASQTIAGGAVAPSSGQLAQIDAAIAGASRTLGPNHPDLQQLRNQRAALQSAVARETAAQPRMVNSGPSLGALYSAQQAKVLENAGAAGEARRLATDVLVLRDQYQKTAARAAELDQEAKSNESGLTLLGDAIAPQTRSFPRYPAIFAVALAAGFALGIFLSLMLEFLWRKVRVVDDLKLLNTPILGAMSGPTNGNPRRTFELPWRKREAVAQ